MNEPETYKVVGATSGHGGGGDGGGNSGGKDGSSNSGAAPIVVSLPQRKGWLSKFFVVLFIASIILNVVLLIGYRNFIASASGGMRESYHSGSKEASKKIALIEVRGVIAGAITDRTLKIIKKVSEDDSVEGVVLVVDSPGGLVADSHEIYDKVKKLAKKKPIYVSMRRLAASGGYYIAMGIGEEGVIFAEPTTWTGSIGVIMPRYDLSEIASKYGVKSDPLTTGEFKDTLNPLKKMTDSERTLWGTILNESYERFVSVIETNREDLDNDAVKKLATGQIYTSKQAIENHLVDEIGFLEDAIAALEKKLGGSKRKVVRYSMPPTLSDIIMGYAQSRDPHAEWKSLLELSAPKQMYLFSSGAALLSESSL